MESFGRYRVLRRLGQGGMAEVLEALAVGEGGFQRRVAIKRIRPDRDPDAVFGKMFLDEARISSQLHHGNIVAVLDYGIVEGLPFQVLEFVDGMDSNRLVNLGIEHEMPLPIELALHVCTEVAHALAYAHEARDLNGRPLGIVHRDVSRANILVSWTGDVKLTDFGIAFATGKFEKTLPGTIKGNRHYMAPEQAIGEIVDPRADIFSLGCVLHALIAKKSPLQEANMLALLAGERTLEIDPAVPPDLRAIIERATRIAKEERYATASQMAVEMGRALAQRLEQDAKTIMTAWLARVRPKSSLPVERAGKYDRLVDLEFVLAEGESELRTFESRAASTLPPLDGKTSPLDGGTTTVPREKAKWPLLVTALALILIALVLVRFRLIEAIVATPIAEAPHRPPPPVALEAPPPSPPPPAPEEAPKPAAPKRVRTAKKKEEPPKIAAPAGSGVLLVAGESVLKGRILVDGEPQGFAPKRLELDVGPHTIEVVRSDGTHVGPGEIHLGAHHTISAPLRWP